MPSPCKGGGTVEDAPIKPSLCKGGGTVEDGGRIVTIPQSAYAASFYRKKLVANQRRYECVYKRIADVCVTFCERGGAVKQVTDFLNKKIRTSVTCSDEHKGAAIGGRLTDLAGAIHKLPE